MTRQVIASGGNDTCVERVVDELGPRVRRTLVARACDTFALFPIERAILTTLLDAMLDREQPGRERRIADLATGGELGGVMVALHDTGTLIGCGLVRVRGTGPLLSRRVALHDSFWPRLVGEAVIGVPAPVAKPPLRLDALVLAPRVAERAMEARRWLLAAHGRRPVVIVQGPEGSGRGALGASVAAELGVGVFGLDGRRLTSAMLPEWRRELMWHQAVPVIEEAECAEPDALAVLAEKFAGPMVLTSTTSLGVRMIAAGRVVHVLEVDRLGPAERSGIWRRALAGIGASNAEIDVEFVGRRFRFGPARIAAAVGNLAEAGVYLDTASAVGSCRALPEMQVGGLASRLSPAQWSDLVVPKRVRSELDLIIAWGRGGTSFQTQAGLACLFHGPPGTGKTLAAQVLAGELGLDLFRVDLSQVADKYIGESEKRLDQLFREAEAAGVVLFFDEADALFAQRTAVRDARDRYANLETSFLLQRLEMHPGLSILATNLIGNIDPAFQRRLAVVVELRPPEREERRRIWEKLLPPRAERSADIEVELLADRIAIAGGDIRNAVFAAHLLAAAEQAPLAMRHLVIAVCREIKKAGRLFDTSLLGTWENAAVAYARLHT